MSMRQLLSAQPFFEGVSARHIDRLAPFASEARFASGERVIQEHGEADCFYLIVSGRLGLRAHVPPRGTVSIQSLGPGELLGWSWLHEPRQWHFDGFARGEVRAIRFDANAVREAMEKDKDLGYAVLQRFVDAILERLQATRLQMLDVYAEHTGVVP